MDTMKLKRSQDIVKKYSSIIEQDMFNSFINYADVKEVTLNGYKTCLKHFYIYLLVNDVNQPTRETIQSYKRYLDKPDIDTAEQIAELQTKLSNNNKKIQPKERFTAGTKRQYLRAVKQFFDWTDTEQLYPNIAKNIKTAKVKQDNSRRDSFTAEDIKIILDNIDTSTEKGARDYSIIILCVTCGLRIIEIQRANIEDMQKVKGQLRLYIQGKGHDDKDDYKKIIPKVEESINHYLSYRKNIKSSQPLFTSLCTRANKNGRLPEPSISRIIKERFIQAGYDTKRLTAHSLRHTSNTLLFESGADLYKVQKHARHQDPKTTEIYIHDKEKETAQNEQAIYNIIFKEESKPSLKDKLEALDSKQLAELESYLEKIGA